MQVSIQPATLRDAGERGARLRQHAAWAAHLRRARARQAHGSRPAPLVVVDACTSSSTRLHSSQYVPVIARSTRLHPSQYVHVVVRTQSERNPAQARGCCSQGFGESTWRRWRGRTPAWSNRLARRCQCDHPPLQKPARARPLAQGHPFGLQPGRPRCLDSEARLRRRSGAGPKSPIPLPLTIQVRGVVRRACRASSRAGGVAGSRVHAQQRRSEHRVAVRSGRRVK